MIEFLAAIILLENLFLNQHNIGVMSGAVLYIRDDLKISSTQEEILIGSLNVCSLIGSLASGKTSDMIGRRFTIILAATTFLLGAVLMGFAPSFAFLMAGRVVAGIGVGYSLMIAPVYTAEISPAMSRGFLTSLPEVFINVGILLGYVSNYGFSSLPQNINWRIMLGIAAVPAMLLALGVLIMPESPRWLVMKGRIEQARNVLNRVSDSKAEAEERLAEILEAAEAGDVVSGGHVWKELFLRPSRPVRRMLVAAIGINFFMQASGNDAVVYYCPEVFKAAGLKKKKQLFGVTILMGFMKTAFVLVSALFLDKAGRRPLLLGGSIGMAISLAGLGVGALVGSRVAWAVVLCVISVCATVSCFSVGLGPITWVYSSEIFPLRLRAQGTAVAVGVNRVVSGAVSMSFLSVTKAISMGGTFFVFSGISALGAIFFYVFLPETKGRTLEEMCEVFEDKKRGVEEDRGRGEVQIGKLGVGSAEGEDVAG
ncbi:polyol transporter 5 [Amborella trichopoda]|nr:polyol transporter 5 [Amborella trichopoda]|eukprot:XP_020518230.1 polyol transporter 5 [Amborella trichopoda]